MTSITVSEATTPIYAPAITLQAAPTKSEIFTVYNQLRAYARKHPDIIDPARVNRALGILQSKAYYMGEKVFYSPTAGSCGCKDWEFRFARRRNYTGACKHMIAEMLLEDILQLRYDHEAIALLASKLIQKVEV